MIRLREAEMGPNSIKELIIQNLREDAKRFSISVFDELASTNLYLYDKGREGANDGTVVIALKQSGGVGRCGRSFYSPNGGNLYMSVLLRPSYSLGECRLITTAAAVAASDAIYEVCGQQTRIKWVNDLYLDDKKVCGILTQASVGTNRHCHAEGLEYIVLGIGINLFESRDAVPDDISNIYGSVLGINNDENGRFEIMSCVAAKLLVKFILYYDSLSKRDFIARYNELLLGKGGKAQYMSGNNIYDITIKGINDETELIAVDDDGRERVFCDGEIRLIPQSLMRSTR